MEKRKGGIMKKKVCLIGLLSVLVTFLSFPTPRGDASGAKPPVQVLWQQDVEPAPSWLVTQTMTVDQGAVPSPLLFVAQEDLPHLLLLNIEMMGWDDAANMGVFWVKKQFPMNTLTPAHPLPVNAIFYGDTPRLGFSYLTPDGKRRYFAVGLSGHDGSCYVEEVRVAGYGSVVGKEEPSEGAPRYGGLLSGIYDILSGGDSEFVEECGGAFGIHEAVSLLGSEAALEQVGYAVRDITGDGVPELLIGLIDEGAGTASFGTTILAVYTPPKAMPVCVLEGSAWNHFRLMEGGRFLQDGTGGVMNLSFGEYALSTDGRQGSFESFYFAAENPLAPNQIAVYYNTTGAFDPARSEKLDMPPEVLPHLKADLERGVRHVNLMPFGFERRPR